MVGPMLLYPTTIPTPTVSSNCASEDYDGIAAGAFKIKVALLIMRLCIYLLGGNNRSNTISYSLVMKEIQSEKNEATS